MEKLFRTGLIGLMVGYFALVGAAGAQENRTCLLPLFPAAPAMTPEEVKAFLDQPLVARLATVRANHTPHLMPMWFLYEDGILYMSTRTQAAKVRHIQANPQIAAAVDVMEAPLKNKVVVLEGKAEVQTTEVKEITTRIYQKYMGKEGAATPTAQRNINTPRVILKITPQKIYTLDSTR